MVEIEQTDTLSVKLTRGKNDDAIRWLLDMEWKVESVTNPAGSDYMIVTFVDNSQMDEFRSVWIDPPKENKENTDELVDKVA